MTMVNRHIPKYCVWELTLACNAQCMHCGSNAGMKRAQELSTDEALDLIDQLHEAGVQSVTFSGGEPLLRADWPELGRAVVAKKMRLEMITNGLLVSQQVDEIANVGFFGVTFSVDGTTPIHDRLRGKTRFLARLLGGARSLKQRGVRIGAATQVNRWNVHGLDSIHELLVNNGFDGWQLQLTMPAGMAAAEQGAMCLAPDELLIFESNILRIKKYSPLFIQAADNFGYMSRSEPRLRSGTSDGWNFFSGCQAGMMGVGITSDGTIRGCLSMPDHFNEGNIRDNSFKTIWYSENAFAYNRKFSVYDLRGECASCAFTTVCRAGCKSLAYYTTGDVAENFYCLRRLQ